MNPRKAAQTHGITYRQLDTWIRAGHIHVPGHGSGTPRDIPTSELPTLTLMARLVRAGLTTTAAAHLARDLTTSGATTARLPGGITLTTTQETQP